MKRLIYIVVCLATLLTSSLDVCARVAADERSSVVVDIDGVRYYLHSVAQRETLYSLSKLYGVTEAQILDANPKILDGLRVGVNINIPTATAASGASGSSPRDGFEEHIVAKGETIYSISRRYNLAVAIIIADNANLDPTELSIGQVINIRKAEGGDATKATETTDATESAEVSDSDEWQDQIAPEGYRYYLVVEGDALRSIAAKSEMSVGELKRVNNIKGGQDLAAGDVLLIKDQSIDQEGDAATTAAAATAATAMQSRFKVLSADDTLHIALMLPLQMRGYNMKPFAEFYQGFMLGIEDMQQDERNIVVNLYNTQRDSSRMEQILSDEAFMRSDLIIGPVYEELLSPVLAFAESRNTPVVSPLVNVEYSDSPVLFQMAPITTNRYAKIGNLLSSDRTVTLIYGASNDLEYEQQIVDLLDSCGMEYVEHQYRYEHVSVVTEREEMLDEKIEEIEDQALSRGRMPDQRVIDSLHLLKISSGDLRPLMANEADYNTFFIMSDSETEVDRILSSMVSAASANYTKLIPSLVDSTFLVTVLVKPSPYEVVANPDWRRYNSIDHTIYFKNRVVNFSSYLAGRESEVIRDFDSRYGRIYDDMPTLYSYRGYDAVKIFAESMYGDMEYGLDGEVFTPLQTTYYFEQPDSLSARRVNTNWMRVNYKPNLKFEIE